MSYEKKLDQSGLNDGETAVLLDSGDLVAVSCFVKRQVNTNNPVYCATARAINPDGSPWCDAHGYEIKTSIRHSACDAEVEAVGDDALRRECMLLVLGEPPTMNGEELLCGWDAGIRASTNIRRAIVVAGNTSRDSAHLL
jgi:hypothetical protein